MANLLRLVPVAILLLTERGLDVSGIENAPAALGLWSAAAFLTLLWVAAWIVPWWKRHRRVSISDEAGTDTPEVQTRDDLPVGVESVTPLVPGVGASDPPLALAAVSGNTIITSQLDLINRSADPVELTARLDLAVSVSPKMPLAVAAGDTVPPTEDARLWEHALNRQQPIRLEPRAGVGASVRGYFVFYVPPAIRGGRQVHMLGQHHLVIRDRISTRERSVPIEGGLP